MSHQWENPLNYFYLEVCWQGYPLAHNATLCADPGYAHRGNDVHEGARKVIDAIDRHDAGSVQYRDHQRALIGRFLSSNPEVVAAHRGLLDELVRMPLR